jgi:uncharacterized protein (DUF433 family)
LSAEAGCVDWREYITFEPGKRGGQPRIRRLRITLNDVLEYRAAGRPSKEFSTVFLS